MFTYIWLIFMANLNVGEYTSPMDSIGNNSMLFANQGFDQGSFGYLHV